MNLAFASLTAEKRELSFSRAVAMENCQLILIRFAVLSAMSAYRSKIGSEPIYSGEQAWPNFMGSYAKITNHPTWSTPVNYSFFMAWSILAKIFSTLLTLFRLGLTSDKNKDLEILILRQHTIWLLGEQDVNFVGLIRDNDSKYIESFDTVFL